MTNLDIKTSKKACFYFFPQYSFQFCFFEVFFTFRYPDIVLAFPSWTNGSCWNVLIVLGEQGNTGVYLELWRFHSGPKLIDPCTNQMLTRTHNWISNFFTNPCKLLMFVVSYVSSLPYLWFTLFSSLGSL